LFGKSQIWRLFSFGFLQKTPNYLFGKKQKSLRWSALVCVQKILLRWSA